jgi:hypothetical protein
VRGWCLKCQYDVVGDATPVGVGDLLGVEPKVGLRSAGQPWALGRNPVGIGGVAGGEGVEWGC